MMRAPLVSNCINSFPFPGEAGNRLQSSQILHSSPWLTVAGFRRSGRFPIDNMIDSLASAHISQPMQVVGGVRLFRQLQRAGDGETGFGFDFGLLGLRVA